MQNKKQLENEVQTLENLSEIIEAYEEIAAMRMRRVKKSVLQNRDFLDGLNSIYRRVVFSYKKYLKKIKHDKEAGATTLRETNGKTVSVFLSANTGLYGDIINKTFDLFMKNIINSPTDTVLVGRLGKSMFDAYGYQRDYKFFELSDAEDEEKDLNEILDYILQYTNIVVYHGIFRSVLNQEPVRSFITGGIFELQEEEESKYLESIIEPSVEEVAGFFERQILASLFEHSTYESSLSKYASRMVSLDLANENINEMRDKADLNLLRQKHRESNSKQLAALAGISIWGS
ncbi:MAG: FoF1 ATP synthase subunit gamma [Candidatus Woesebacteria bacterium]|jgi:ATP synthase F1 gamma subunit